MHGLLFKAVVSLRIKEGREEIKNAVREDACVLASHQVTLDGPRGTQNAAPTREASDLWGLVRAFGTYLCKAMRGRTPRTYCRCRIPVNYFKMSEAIRAGEK